jgi:hypothetical protein
VVLGREAPEHSGDVLIRVISTDRLLLDRGQLGLGMLADRLVGRPIRFLTLGGLMINII